MTESFNLLVHKLNAFKFKYYSFKLLKGIVFTLFFLLVVYTAFSLVEYFVYLSSEVRKILFFGYLVFALLLFVQFIGIPILKLLHVLKPLDLKSATVLIQKHFTEIEDKLLNVIELSNLSEKQYSNDIVIASINQKIEELKPFNFNDAVKVRNLKIASLYLLFGVFVSTVLLVVNKNIYKESTHRLVHYNEQFVKPAPFNFELINTRLKAKKGDAYNLQVKTTGEEIPQILYVNISGNNYLMKSAAAGMFEFEMASVINPVQFYFTDLKFNSDVYKLELLPKPGITNFNTSIYPPAYTGLQNKVFENIGDLQIPNGTKVEWNFSGIDVDSLYFVVNDSIKMEAVGNGNAFQIDSKFYKSTLYNVFVQNIITEPELALSYSIEVIPDLFPEIEIVQIQDSTQLTRYFFKGIIGDDYGFSALQFHYNINNSDSTLAIPFVRLLNDQEFYFSFDFNDMEVSEGIVSYYFSVSDNDVINNYKTTTSNSFNFQFPNKDEILANESEQFEALQQKVMESQKMAREIKEDLKNLQLKNMDTNVSEWEKSQMVNDVISKQNKLEQLYDQIKQENEKLNNYKNSFTEQNNDILEKQKQIEELLEEVFTDELKKLMEEFNKLAEEFDSKKLNQLSEQMDLTYEDLEKQLDKNLQMLKKMKVEQKIQDVINDINKLAQEEEKLAQDISENKNFEEAENVVEKHKEDLSKLEEQLNDALEMNKDLKEPMNMDDFDEEFKDAEDSMENTKEQLGKKNKKKSSTGAKNTSEKLQNMAFGMQQMLDSNTMEQNMENIENLKQLLSNLILLSFEQEDVLTDLQGITTKDPALVQLNKLQNKIVDQSKIVKDSLYALAERTPQITSMVNNELVVLELNLNKAKQELEEALFPNARASQQFVITASNNLALMLNEALENLEEQMANAQPGDQQCEKPGNGKPGMPSLKESSESIKQQLQNMIEQMKNGGKQKGMGQQMGQSLMQHEMMQQMLRDMMNGESVGSGTKEILKGIDEMLEQNRKQLMNKTVNAEMIARQNLITTRLLEAEKAELEREFEDKRESESADEFYSNPVKFFEYNNNDNFTIEYLNRNSHKLQNFYNNKYKQYLNNIEKKGGL